MLSDLFAASLEGYENQTGIKLSEHPLAEQLRCSDSADSVTAILQEQVSVCSEFGGTDRITKSLSSVISVLYALSVSIPRSLSLVESLYVGFVILLSAAKDVSELDLLVDLLESIESILKHLDICTKVPQTAAMTETVVKTLVELLSTLGLATKLVKQRQPRTFVKELFGGNFDQMVLERLDRLTLDEGRITAPQIIKVVYGLVENIRVVMDDGKSESCIGSIWDALEDMHHIVSDVNKSKRDKLQQDIQSWLSPPDPSINHKVSCELRHTGTTAWFIRGDTGTFSGWKWSKTGSLLWIHGKPGSGKSILCSAIIRDIDTMKRAGLVSLAYYYFDFKDYKKKDLRGLVSSLLVQLCHQSDSYCDMVSDFYSKHAEGSGCPSDAALTLCLKRILKHPGRTPIYLIVDALDECPTTSDMLSARQKVLILVRQLMTSEYPNLHMCLTSRLESDLSDVLEPLSSRSVSLHDESGQREDIASYINSVVSTDPKMRGWRAGDKELVTNVLTHNVDGIFQWASCQVAYLRNCPRRRLRRTLDDLPQTLDGTYQRTLQDVSRTDRAVLLRLFSCVSVARRPLRVEELAKLLAFNSKRGPSRIFNRGWDQNDVVNAAQTTYSSLLAIVKDENTTIIQFSHHSVQEFFGNPILANASANVSYFYVPMERTHTLVTQACLDVLLRLDGNVVNRASLRRFPLIEYAAENWIYHVRFGDLSGDVEGRMKQIFDPRKSHLVAWLWIYDGEVPRSMRTERAERPTPLTGTPLHYAALWGLHTIVKFLIIEHSQDVQAPGFTAMTTPLHLAAKKGHVEVARFLLECGANVTAQDMDIKTPLHLASQEGQLEVARFLIDHGADMNARDIDNITPLHLALRAGHMEVSRFLIDHGADVNALDMDSLAPLHLALGEGHLEVARFLIDHGADVNTRNTNGLTPLHLASQQGQLVVSRFLITQAADVNAQDMDSLTPLHLALRAGHLGVARFLINHGADVNTRGMDSLTPLHLALREGHMEVARFLIDHDADVNARGMDSTPLHLALRAGHLEIACLFINHGADVNARDVYSLTPLHLASQEGQLEVALFLIDRGANVNARDMSRLTPLHLASREGQVEVAGFLINYGADVNTRDMYSLTPLHLASREGQLEVAHFLIDQGADMNARDMDSITPFHLALRAGHLEVARFLIEHGVDLDSRDMESYTPLHLASRDGQLEVACFLIDHGVDVNALDMYSLTPLHLASREGQTHVARVLLAHGADTNPRDDGNCTPLHLASRRGKLDVARFLIDHGADVNACDIHSLMPLHLASREGQLEVSRFLIDHGADVNARDMYSFTPVHLASQEGRPHVARVLLEHGAGTDAQDDSNCTPLHLASQLGHSEVVRVLIEHGTDPNARDYSNWTPLHGASQGGHLDVVQFLLNHGADPHASDHGGWTSLQLPSHNGDLEIVRMLLKHGANANTRDNGHWTPLHGASQGGHWDVVRLLLEYGADVDSRDDSNQTPLHMAARAGYPELVSLFVQNSADINSRNDEGRTPLEEALARGHPNTVRLLLLSELPFGTREDGA